MSDDDAPRDCLGREIRIGDAIAYHHRRGGQDGQGMSIGKVLRLSSARAPNTLLQVPALKVAVIGSSKPVTTITNTRACVLLGVPWAQVQSTLRELGEPCEIPEGADDEQGGGDEEPELDASGTESGRLQSARPNLAAAPRGRQSSAPPSGPHPSILPVSRGDSMLQAFCQMYGLDPAEVRGTITFQVHFGEEG